MWLRRFAAPKPVGPAPITRTSTFLKSLSVRNCPFIQRALCRGPWIGSAPTCQPWWRSICRFGIHDTRLWRWGEGFKGGKRKRARMSTMSAQQVPRRMTIEHSRKPGDVLGNTRSNTDALALQAAGTLSPTPNFGPQKKRRKSGWRG